MHQKAFDASSAKAVLHLSESPFALPQKYLDIIAGEARRLHLYPEPASVSAVESLAAHWGISPDHLVVCNGCDEAILNTFLKFGVGGNILVSAHSYPGYREIADLAGIPLRQVPLDLVSWQQDTEAILGAIDQDTKLAILCNPHNPTGSLLEAGHIDAFVRECNKRDVIPIIDEAYVDYANGGRSFVQDVDKFEKILIWKSFAKSHGLAGIRLGAAVGTPSLLRRLKDAAESNPFSVNRISQRILLEITKDEDVFHENRSRVKAIRTKVQRSLDNLGVWYNPSHANFIFLHAPLGLSGEEFYEKSGIFVRDCKGYDLRGYWRVACGSEIDMSLFLTSLKQFL